MGTIMMIWFLNKRAALLPPRMGNLQFGSFINSGGYRLGRTRGKATGTSMAAHHRNKATRRTKKEVVSMYEKWIVEHGKLYNTPEEKDKRFQIFKNNLRYIDKANSANRGCSFGLNQFSDLTSKEFEATYLCDYSSLMRTRGKATGTSMAAHHRDKATERTEEEVVSLYEKWIVEHDRLYTPEEKDKRFQIFKDNMLLIDKEKTANQVPGPFADMTNEEFKALFSPIDPNEVIYDIPFF